VTPDVNVLVAASRSDHPHHAVALAWLEQALEEAKAGRPLALQPLVIASFLRLVTHARVFVQATPMPDALRFIDALLDAPGVHQPELGAEWAVFRALCLDQSLAANDIPDAWLAAAVVQQSDHLVTFDADFRRLLKRGQFTRLAA
jgi:toxin-antitoxin system PIN domain toxin